MLLQEIRHSIRMLMRSPGFTVVAALSIALGIGVNSALFSFHDAILLRPLPVRDPGSVVVINTGSPEEPPSAARLSYANFSDLRARSQSFEGLLAAQTMVFSFARSRQASRETRMGMVVSDNFFALLGVQPMLGRGFNTEEGRAPGRDAVIVLGYDFWKNTLGGDGSILDSGVIINGIEFKVIGIASESFTGLDQFVRPSFYLPLMMTAQLSPGIDNPFEDRKARQWDVRGRLKSGVSLKAAEAEVSTLWKELQRQHPDVNRNHTMTVRNEYQHRIRATPANAVISVLMTTLAALVLMIACANVANLMLGRARARSREIAIRVALGVSRMRLLRQLSIESLLLAGLGGALGVGFGYGGIRFLRDSAQAIVPPEIPVVIAAQLDLRVLIFCLAATVVSAKFFGLAPAWQSLRVQLTPALKSAELSTRRRLIGRSALVVMQVALSMVLLVTAGMVEAGVRRILALDPGFRTDHLITMALDTSFVRYTPTQTHRFYRDLVDRAGVLPGVRSVALTDALPLDRHTRLPVIPEGHAFPPGTDSASVIASVVDANYFATLKTQIVHGRAFSAADDERGRRVVIVNELFAATYWPNQSAIGKRIRLNSAEGQWLDIVGVAKTEKYSNVLEAPMPFLYLPFAQHETPQMTLVVETIGADASPLATPLREIVRSLDVNQPVFGLRSFTSFYEREATGAPSLIMRTAAGMGLLGLTLALVGLYGLISFSVVRRTREIGIRVAVGAGRLNVLSMFLREGMILAAIGILVGSGASIAVARLLMAGTAGLGAPNAAAYAIVPLLVIGLTFAATYIPARRASKMDPLRALKYD
jgi:macrolide transport system ATP-binding/permease protein